MTHRFAIDLRSINYINCKRSFDLMVSNDMLNEQNLKEHILAFYSLVNNLKSLNDSMLFEIGGSEKVKQNLQMSIKLGHLSDEDNELLNELQSIRNYCIHHKKLGSFLFGTMDNYVHAIKNRDEFLEYQRNLDLMEPIEREALSLMLKYLDKKNAEKLLSLTFKLCEAADPQIQLISILREV